jgi:hypothetical protein
LLRLGEVGVEISSVSMITTPMEGAAKTPTVRLTIATERRTSSFMVLECLGFERKDCVSVLWKIRTVDGEGQLDVYKVPGGG